MRVVAIIPILLLSVVGLPLPGFAQSPAADRLSHGQQSWPLYPEVLAERPDIPSPWTATDGREVLLVRLKDGRYALVPVTVENGTPLLYSTKIPDLFGKDRQLAVDSGDFPTLARTGLHAEAELRDRPLITGLPVEVITSIGRPGRFSGTGFLANDEEILDVLIGDNRRVSALGLTHPQLARPLFHIWNLILKELEVGRWARHWDHIPVIIYNGQPLELTAEGGKGWQMSIFQDEIQGRFNITVRRTMSDDERTFLRRRYPHLSTREHLEMEDRLSRVHFSEMLPFYIMRYGFYEGHTDYRADPLAIARVFGLRSLEEIEAAFPGKLERVLTAHYTRADTDK